MTESRMTTQALAAMVPSLAGKKVLLIGDVMVDEYLTGEAERISPEAPVPVVRVFNDRHVLGGAGNVARNLCSLGGVPHLVCITGTGSGSDLLDSLLTTDGIDHTFIRIAGRQTTRKTRIIASRQQMLRIDREDTSPINGAVLEEVLGVVAACINDYEVCIVSDYGKGLVTQNFMERLVALRDASASKPLILVDPKTPNFKWYKNVFMLTPNAKETSEGANMPVGTQEEIVAAGQAIFDLLGCDRLLTTLGPRGMALFEGRDAVWHIPTMAQEVFDVTGAGDTVIATAALALAARLPLLESCMLANYAAGVVVGHVGAATVSPEGLVEAIKRSGIPDVQRWV
ncbi:bifunctional ADP-heptose synthase [Desulfovibrio mangrovi]|uniref:bifunctional heptose 7-phosphate kinase/heptose 1-phosphate adenyltransferase n=1 Tax=Desulfovibrio mangrovi TaxID=2976983 RepID=UPI002245E310|nr:bifunctional ADP-heptose synthase [Desulfovibrio mangrovi]UZP66557.1 bifunctional ADP-heptose synthase [Desulfovibrio mangrovi]